MMNWLKKLTLSSWSSDLKADFTLGNCLFGAVKLIKNNDPDKFRYSGYGIGFHSWSLFSWSDGSWGKNVVIFGAGKSSSVLVYNKKKAILVLGECPTQGLNDTALILQNQEKDLC